MTFDRYCLDSTRQTFSYADAIFDKDEFAAVQHFLANYGKLIAEVFEDPTIKEPLLFVIWSTTPLSTTFTRY